LKRFMLDTNAVAALMREPRTGVAARLAQADTTASISAVVAGELRFGVAKKGSDRMADTVERLLHWLDIEPITPEVAKTYGRLRAELEAQGQPMDANDLWIAAHALSLDRLLVTDDRAFERVRGLALENWAR
jgi:tRNA(fMet)-specific endonuclease VapC